MVNAKKYMSNAASQVQKSWNLPTYLHDWTENFFCKWKAIETSYQRVKPCLNQNHNSKLLINRDVFCLEQKAQIFLSIV